MTHNLPLSAARLWDSLMEMAKIGATAKGGCNRQALTDTDAAGRALLLAWGKALGLTPMIDRLGTIGLLRPGRDPTRKPVAIGSHLDTVPTGGKFDGVYGVLAGLEIMRALQEAGAELVLAGERIALDTGGDGMASITRISVTPDARGNIPSGTRMLGSARHQTTVGLEAMLAAWQAAADRIAAARGVAIRMERGWGYPETQFDPVLLGRLEASAARRGLAAHRLPTPIGHDAIHLGRVLPAAMLFIPCHGGLSHNEAESITREWAEAGLMVLADAVIETAGLVR